MATDSRTEAYGESGLSPVDRFGARLSQRAILPHVRDGARVLDLGCGYDATLLCSLAGRVGSATGVDVSISDAARRTPGTQWHEGFIEEVLPRLGNHDYNLVMLISVLEHLSDPDPILAECHRVLAPGGTLLVNVPTWRAKRILELFAFRLGLSPAAEMDDHKMYYDLRDLWPRLVSAGFRPSRLKLRTHKFGLNLFAVAHRGF